MAYLDEKILTCPYCGESITVLIESVGDEISEYIEDCQVCCRPILFSVENSTTGEMVVEVRQENE